MKDIYQDEISVECGDEYAEGEIYLGIKDTVGNEPDGIAVAALTPPLARKLARKLLKAADKAETHGA